MYPQTLREELPLEAKGRADQRVSHRKGQVLVKKLVSFIGLARRNEKDSEGYLRTPYEFEDGQTIETSIFTEALIKHNKPEISECILIGTRSSSWGSLIERYAFEEDICIDLYDAVEKQFSDSYIQDDTLSELDTALQLIWGIPVRCVAHKEEISSENVLDILFQYARNVYRTTNLDLLLDITHGFRSMPVILMSAIQLLDSTLMENLKIDIIYGEIRPNGNSKVRYLDSVWHATSFARALRLFNDSLESELLAEYLIDEWPEGARAIERLTTVLQSNFYTRLDECLAQMKNAMSKLKLEEAESEYIRIAHSSIENVYQRLRKPETKSSRVFAAAKEFAARNNFAKAIMYLYFTLELLALEETGDLPEIGNYKVTKKSLETFRKRYEKTNPPKCFKRHYWKLIATRNAIAHGGFAGGKGGLPDVQNLKKSYYRYQGLIESIIAGRDS